MKELLIVLLSFLSFAGICQQPSFPSIDQKDFPKVLLGKTKTYTGESLFGYMDGGAELYLEYGFSGARVSEITIDNSSFTIEIFRMNGPEEAFGIFSVSRFKCTGTPPLSPFTCQTPYQLQICSGPFYINIINNTGNKADSVISLKIGEHLTKKISEASADLREYFPGIPPEKINHEVIMVRGSQSVLNSVPDLADFFGESSGYYAAVLYELHQTHVSMRFTTIESLNDFIKSKGWNPSDIAKGSNTMSDGKVVAKLSENRLRIVIR